MYTDDPVEIYIKEVRRIPRMTREREMECIRHICAGDEHGDLAARDLFEANLSLVVAIAQRHHCPHIHMLDLIVTDNNALFRALQAFTESDAEDFTAFATPFIEEAIAHQVTNPDL